MHRRHHTSFGKQHTGEIQKLINTDLEKLSPGLQSTLKQMTAGPNKHFQCVYIYIYTKHLCLYSTLAKTAEITDFIYSLLKLKRFLLPFCYIFNNIFTTEQFHN